MTDEHWAGTSRRARVAALALAVVLAVLTFVVVNGVWRRAAPPAPAPTAQRVVEVRVLPATAPAPSAPSQ